MGQRGRFDYSRRAVLGFAGAVTLATTLRTKDALAQAPGGKMRIGVIGSGHIGSTIGGLWVKAGHPVLFSSRHPEELKELVAGLGPLAQNGTVQQAIAFGDALLIAVPYGALPQIGQEYSDALKGKITLDACNAVAARDGAIAEEAEREANRPDPKLAVPIAGDDTDALTVASGLVRDAGFEPVIVGKLVDARRFQRGALGYGQAVSAAELRQKLSLTP